MPADLAAALDAEPTARSFFDGLSYIVKPRGEVHAMWNAGKTPARMIEIMSPAGFEEFFRELADMNEAGATTLEAVGALAGRYQLPFAESDWLPGIIDRYGLTPPPRF